MHIRYCFEPYPISNPPIPFQSNSIQSHTTHYAHNISEKSRRFPLLVSLHMSFVISADLGLAALTCGTAPCSVAPSAFQQGVAPTATSACPQQWTKVDIAAGNSPPFTQSYTTQSGTSVSLPLQAGSAGAAGGSPVEFFHLRHAQTGKYMAAQYSTVHQPPLDASTAFTIVATAHSTADALICAAVELDAGEGAQENTLLVWLNKHDTEPKALCLGTGSAVRCYAFPPQCFHNASGRACALSWQTCNPTTGYCDDTSAVTPQAPSGSSSPPPIPTPSSPIATSGLVFPNCTSRRLAGLFAISSPSTCPAVAASPSNTLPAPAPASSDTSTTDTGLELFGIAAWKVITIAAVVLVFTAVVVGVELHARRNSKDTSKISVSTNIRSPRT